MSEEKSNFPRRKILFLSDKNLRPISTFPHKRRYEEIQNSYAIVTKKRKKMPPIDPTFMINSALLPEKHDLTEFNRNDNKSQNDSQHAGKQESKQNLTLKNEGTTEKKEVISGQIKEKKIKEKERKENIILERGGIARTHEEDAQLERWKKELLNDEDWCATLVRFSGKGLAALEHAGEAMEIFFDFLLLRDEKTHRESLKEFKLHFVSWWRYNNFTFDMDELRTGKRTLPAGGAKAQSRPRRSRRWKRVARRREKW